VEKIPKGILLMENGESSARGTKLVMAAILSMKSTDSDFEEKQETIFSGVDLYGKKETMISC
jgi:hypothetical protein